MTYSIEIKDILNFLEKQGVSYTFHGNQRDSIEGFSTLFNYKSYSMTFITHMYNFEDYIDLFENKTIQLIISSYSEKVYDCFNNVIQTEKPARTFFSLLDRFFNDETIDSQMLSSDISNIKKTSYISEKATIGKNVKIGRGCIIEPNVYIGDNTEIHHNVVVRSNTRIGDNCTIYSGAVIGERGFNPNTLEDGSRIMLNHYGGVQIEDNVHIGENCTISKGSIEDTVIESGVKLSSNIRVSHNVRIGSNTVVTISTHICGSVDIGKNCHIAATTIRNHCRIGDGATLGLGSVVVKDVEAGLTVVGNPAKPLKK